MRYIFFLGIISICVNSSAATIIERINMGQKQKITLDGKHARIENLDNPANQC